MSEKFGHNEINPEREFMKYPVDMKQLLRMRFILLHIML